MALLASVQSFYQRLMGEHLGGEIPTPAELTREAIGRDDDVRSTLKRMKVWIQLLDMAIFIIFNKRSFRLVRADCSVRDMAMAPRCNCDF